MMKTATFHRVVADPDTSWDSTRAIMLGAEGDWCLYVWSPADKLLLLDYFDHEGEYQTWEGFYFGGNPLPSMFEDSDVPVGDDWVDAGLVAA
jgi:hypothetical protein